MARVNIEGLNKTNLLIALYNRANKSNKPQLTEEVANKFLTECPSCILTIQEVELKVDLSGNTLYTYSYDKLYGMRAASDVIDSLKRVYRED